MAVFGPAKCANARLVLIILLSTFRKSLKIIAIFRFNISTLLSIRVDISLNLANILSDVSINAFRIVMLSSVSRSITCLLRWFTEFTSCMLAMSESILWLVWIDIPKSIAPVTRPITPVMNHFLQLCLSSVFFGIDSKDELMSFNFPSMLMINDSAVLLYIVIAV